MRIVRDIHELAACHFGSLVPTMGALHDGHLALIRDAAQCGDPVVVSIFVNPTQFGPDEDFERYPRDLDHDRNLAADAGATIIFAPSVETMYPQGVDLHTPTMPPVATSPGLEQRHRPGHFAGVCQVVARLFDLLQPAVAVFGEKDFQQLRVIQQMVQTVQQTQPNRWGNLRVESVETVREPDGLAMSSRNAYLDTAQRQRALGLSQALSAAQTLISEAGDDTTPDAVEQIMRTTLDAHHLDVDYAAVRDAHTLLPIDDITRPARALIAAHVDHVRLIDNASINTHP